MDIPKVILPDVLGDVSNGLAVAGLINTMKSKVNTIIDEKENVVGNPSVDGQVLSSTTAGVRSWITPAAGGGGGGSIELQKDGTQVVAAASVLNFTEGLYVDVSGNVSTLQDGILDWSFPAANPTSTPVATQGLSAGLSWSGAAGAGFSSVPAASLAALIPDGVYFELTIPTAATNITMLVLDLAEPNPSAILNPRSDANYVSLQAQAGALASIPPITAGGYNQPTVGDNTTFGLEISGGGIVYLHSGGARTLIHAGLAGPLSLSGIIADQASASLSMSLDINPTVPAQVTSGVVALGTISKFAYPSPYPVKAVTTEEIQAIAATHGEITYEAQANSNSVREIELQVSNALTVANTHHTASKKSTTSFGINNTQLKTDLGLKTAAYKDTGTDIGDIPLNAYPVEFVGQLGSKVTTGVYKCGSNISDAPTEGFLNSQSYNNSQLEVTAHGELSSSYVFQKFTANNNQTYTRIGTVSNIVGVAWVRIDPVLSLGHSSTSQTVVGSGIPALAINLSPNSTTTVEAQGSSIPSIDAWLDVEIDISITLTNQSATLPVLSMHKLGTAGTIIKSRLSVEDELGNLTGADTGHLFTLPTGGDATAVGKIKFTSTGNHVIAHTEFSIVHAATLGTVHFCKGYVAFIRGSQGLDELRLTFANANTGGGSVAVSHKYSRGGVEIT